MKFRPPLNHRLPLLPIPIFFKSICISKVDLLVTQFPHKAYSFADELTLAGMPISTQKLNICVFKGLKPEFHYLVTTLATFSSPISFQKFTQSPP
ncbi:hypothetical protein CFP56_028689 [Quercus suber]|uniref:Uncharacterized protein n=1 Tax=Quercus suber TaxID=58331 RepID=A0AAW0LXH5_QUESU